MIGLREVLVAPRKIADLTAHLQPGQERMLAAGSMRHHPERTIWHVNSTEHGGGVAEMLRPMVGYSRALGLPVRWLVLDAPPEFFEITKRIDNGISGVCGDGGPLGYAEHEVYQSVLARAAAVLEEHVSPGDQVFLHDPQTAGLVGYVRRAGAVPVWRAHNGADEPNQHTGVAWEFLRAYLRDAHALVFTLPHFAPAWHKSLASAVIPPFIDPASPKNQPMSERVALSVLARCDLIDAEPSAPPVFTRFDGTTATAELRPTVVREGRPPSPDSPLVLQVSRWDAVKDMPGVMLGFAEHVAPRSDATLMLVGPEVTGVADDPEAAQVFDDCVKMWRALDMETRSRIQLVCLPMADPDVNAAVVNALQRHATVIVQKSLSEGFGLTATEAMWKAKPLVTSAVGGLRFQVPDLSVGTALTDPLDLRAFGNAVTRYLADPANSRTVGERARARVAEQFLPDTHLLAELALLRDLSEMVLR